MSDKHTVEPWAKSGDYDIKCSDKIKLISKTTYKATDFMRSQVPALNMRYCRDRAIECVNALDGVGDVAEFMAKVKDNSITSENTLACLLEAIHDGEFIHEVDDKLIEALENLNKLQAYIVALFPPTEESN